MFGNQGTRRPFRSVGMKLRDYSRTRIKHYTLPGLEVVSRAEEAPLPFWQREAEAPDWTPVAPTAMPVVQNTSAPPDYAAPEQEFEPEPEVRTGGLPADLLRIFELHQEQADVSSETEPPPLIPPSANTPPVRRQPANREGTLRRRPSLIEEITPAPPARPSIRRSASETPPSDFEPFANEPFEDYDPDDPPDTLDTPRDSLVPPASPASPRVVEEGTSSDSQPIRRSPNTPNLPSEPALPGGILEKGSTVDAIRPSTAQGIRRSVTDTAEEEIPRELNDPNPVSPGILPPQPVRQDQPAQHSVENVTPRTATSVNRTSPPSAPATPAITPTPGNAVQRITAPNDRSMQPAEGYVPDISSALEKPIQRVAGERFPDIDTNPHPKIIGEPFLAIDPNPPPEPSIAMPSLPAIPIQPKAEVVVTPPSVNSPVQPSRTETTPKTDTNASSAVQNTAPLPPVSSAPASTETIANQAPISVEPSVADVHLHRESAERTPTQAPANLPDIRSSASTIGQMQTVSPDSPQMPSANVPIQRAVEPRSREASAPASSITGSANANALPTVPAHTMETPSSTSDAPPLSAEQARPAEQQAPTTVQRTPRTDTPRPSETTSRQSISRANASTSPLPGTPAQSTAPLPGTPAPSASTLSPTAGAPQSVDASGATAPIQRASASDMGQVVSPERLVRNNPLDIPDTNSDLEDTQPFTPIDAESYTSPAARTVQRAPVPTETEADGHSEPPDLYTAMIEAGMVPPPPNYSTESPARLSPASPSSRSSQISRKLTPGAASEASRSSVRSSSPAETSVDANGNQHGEQTAIGGTAASDDANRSIVPESGSSEADLLRLLGMAPDTPVYGLRQPDNETVISRAPIIPSMQPSHAPEKHNDPPLSAAMLDDQVIERAPSSNSSTPTPGTDGEADSANVEKLARDVYQLLRNRLRIEQERRSWK